MLLAMVGIAPAAAQSFDGDVLVAEPSLEDVCGLFEGLEEGLEDLAELFGGLEGLEGFEPEPVDEAEFADLAAALDGLLEGDAMSVNAVSDGQSLVVTVMPDITECEGLEGLEELQGADDLGGGTFLIQPSVDEFCGLIEETLGGLEDLDEDAMAEFGDNGDLAAELEGFAPEPVADDDRERFEPIGAALADLIEGSDDAAQATATSDGESLVVVLTPGIEQCLDVIDIGDEVDDEGLEEIEAPTEVPSGLGVSSNGPSLPVAMAIVGLFLLLAGGRGLMAHRSGS